MSDVAEFVRLRPTLFGVAYRMLGSVADAEDVLQDAYLRWQGVDAAEVRSAEAFLTTIVVRLSLDQLRSARARRETYVGPWLPEPLVIDDADPAVASELADSLSMAFLVLLETLSPLERAAFLLREVFGYDYDEIGIMLDKRPPACRQLVARARRHVDERRRRYDADRSRGVELAHRFLEACLSGNLDDIMPLLSDDATVWTDGGGIVKAARRPIVGARKAARFLVAITATASPTTTTHDAVINGQPGLLLVDRGAVVATLALDILEGRIVGVRIVSNPQKLASIRSPL